MADTDPLTLFPTTTPTTAPPASGGDKDDPLKLFPTTTAPAAKNGTPPLPNVSEYGDLGNAWWNTQAQPPPGQEPTPFSLEALRDKIQQGDMSALNYLKPGADDNALSRYGKEAAMLGVHTLAGLAQWPVSALIGLTKDYPQIDPQGHLVVPGATINPSGSLGATPESIQAATVGATPLRFSEAPGGLVREPVSPLTLTKPPPVTPAELNAAIGRADQAPAPTPSPPVTPPVAGSPQPSSVGAAAAPPRLVNITPAEETMYRNSAEGNKLLENQQIGVQDNNTYIPNVTPNQAELEQTVNAARELKSLGIQSTEASQDAKLAAEANNDARVQYWKDTRGSDADAYREKAQQQEDINTAKKTVFSPDNVVGNVDMAPVVQQIDDTMNLPVNRENTAMQKVFGDLRSRLVDDSGTPRTMPPEQAWGLRQDIDRMTSQRMQADDPNLHYVAHDLNGVADSIDTQTDKMAPGYRDMVSTYAAHARNLDQMQLLKDAEINKGLFRGPNQQMNYNDFQRFMKNVVDARSTPSTDLNPYKSITDDTMQRLWNLRDDLRRSAGAQELARAPGSDTMPNIIDALKQYGKMGGSAAIDVAATHLLGPVAGPLAARGLRAVAAPIAAQRAEMGVRARMQQMLNPQAINPLNQASGLPPSPLTPPP